ncbi:cell division protein FtsK [Angustibacter sp. McL0619]|uniref:cell division protein FtsK n=1 Tax=Angustibacter sp. McL0619 TaxID=3415676 RepID=UPI003CF55B78
MSEHQHPEVPEDFNARRAEDELFARLEADLDAHGPTHRAGGGAAGDPDRAIDDLVDAEPVDAEVVDLDEHRRRPVDPGDPGDSADPGDPIDADASGTPVRATGRARRRPGAVEAGPVLRRFAGGRRDVLPVWARDWASMGSAARWAVGSVWHAVCFHTVRVPLYWCRLTGRAPVGAARLLARWGRWAWDVEGREMRVAMTTQTRGRTAALVQAARSGAGLSGAASTGMAGGFAGGFAGGAVLGDSRLDTEMFLRVTQHHRATVRTRLLLSLVAVAAGAPFTVAMAAGLAGVAQVLAVAIVLPLLGLAGRSADRPVTIRATDSAAIPRLTAELIETALGALGIAELNKGLKAGGEAAVRFPGPITRDGPGWRADVDLPPGVTAGDVIERRDRLASGLRRPLGCVWPEVDADAHAGRLVLWVGDRPLSGGQPVTWPLAGTGRGRQGTAVNVFDPVPIGVDQRHRPVTVTLMFAAGIIGAVPRMGKTFLLRLLLLAASLDPRVELHVYDLKGGGDALPLAAVAHRHRVGDEPEDIDYLRADLRELHTNMRARYKTIRSLPHEVCPESKVTDALASRRELGLHPVLLAMDECQIAFEHPEHGKQITELVTDLVKRGPAVGIMVWCATQRPDAKSLPTGISANAVLRLCLRVMGQLENDMVLGTSMYKAGVRATMLSRRDLGVAILAGEGDDPLIVRTAYVDSPTAALVATRARAARLAAGLLTGHAAGLDQTDPLDQDVSVLEHLLNVWPAGSGRVWSDDLAGLLATTYPGRYDGWTGEQVTAAVKPHGITTRQIKRRRDGEQINKRGLDREEVSAAHHTTTGTSDPGGPPVDQPPVYQPHVDQPHVDQQAIDQQAIDKQAIDKQAIDKQGGE